MDSYKPLFTKKELKRLCDQKRRSYSTPLEQARHAINIIAISRQQKLYKYEPNEWGEDSKNEVYMKIAREYLRRKSERIKARKEAKLIKENL